MAGRTGGVRIEKENQSLSEHSPYLNHKKEIAMSFPQILEVAIGLIFVYYVMGSIVSTISQMIMESLETRGVALEKYLKMIVGEKYLGDLTNMPQIQSLRPIRFARWWNVFGAGTIEKRVEKIPAATLVDAFFDLSGLTGKYQTTGDELIATLTLLPDSEGKKALLGWVQKGVININDLRSRTNDYFTGMLNQAAATFKANARSLVIILSIVITLLLGTDSFQLAKDLWADSALRAVATAQANAAAQQGQITNLTALLNQLGTLSIKIGWWQTQNIPLQTTTAGWAEFILLKFAGLAITAMAVSQGSSFWYDLLKKLTGQPSSSSTISGGGSSDGSGAVG